MLKTDVMFVEWALCLYFAKKKIKCNFQSKLRKIRAQTSNIWAIKRHFITDSLEYQGQGACNSSGNKNAINPVIQGPVFLVILMRTQAYLM